MRRGVATGITHRSHVSAHEFVTTNHHNTCLISGDFVPEAGQRLSLSTGMMGCPAPHAMENCHTRCLRAALVATVELGVNESDIEYPHYSFRCCFRGFIHGFGAWIRCRGTWPLREKEETGYHEECI